MHTIDTSSRTGAHAQKHRRSQQQPMFAQERRILHLINALQSLDDGTLSQIGIERSEIARFAHAKVAHNL